MSADFHDPTPASPGPYCTAVGIRNDNIIQRITQLAPSEVKNGVVYELYLHVKAAPCLSWSDLLPAFEAVFQQELNTTALCGDILGNVKVRVRVQYSIDNKIYFCKYL